MALLDQRLTVTLDYFNKKTKDLLLSKPIPDYVGMKRPVVNAGTMTNSGFEVALGWQEKMHDFKYSINITATSIPNEVTSLAGGDSIYGGSALKLGNTTITIKAKSLLTSTVYKPMVFLIQ